MKITQFYSHLNGLEYLLVHKKRLWSEIKKVIKSVDANACRTKVSKEKLYNIIRNGRGVPAVPLVLIGVEP